MFKRSNLTNKSKFQIKRANTWHLSELDFNIDFGQRITNSSIAAIPNGMNEMLFFSCLFPNLHYNFSPTINVIEP